jgi:hypothetical protein
VDQLKLVVVGRRVADGDPLQRLLLGLGADVDPDLVDLGHLLAVRLVHQVDGALAGHALHRALLGLDHDPPAGDHGPVVAADGVKVDEPVLVHVGDDEAELVHVARHHEGRVARGIEGGDPVAEGVTPIGVGRRLHVPLEDRLGLGLVAGGGAGVEELSEEGGYV